VLPHPTISTACMSWSGCIALNDLNAGSSGYDAYRAALISRNTCPLSGFNFVSTAGGVHAGGEPVIVLLVCNIRRHADMFVPYVDIGDITDLVRG
jgi:hypothetical protein